MRIAVFSDIHANWEALQTAADYAKKQAIDRYAVLGDTVGYGANPNECFEWAIEQAGVFVLGNHEKAVIDPALQEWFNPVAREAIVWTSQVMDPKFKREISGLPYLKIEKEFSFAHGSLEQPEQFHYIMSFSDAVPSFEKMETRVCFVGHTHIPSCFCEQPQEAAYLKAGIQKLNPACRYLLNPGSIGQPRDRNSQLSFGIFDDALHSFEIVRLDYDNQKAAAKIRKAGLPDYLAERLL